MLVSRTMRENARRRLAGETATKFAPAPDHVIGSAALPSIGTRYSGPCELPASVAIRALPSAFHATPVYVRPDVSSARAPAASPALDNERRWISPPPLS